MRSKAYLYHSEHWRSAPSYVALTRHREKAELFVATNTAPDLKQLARQMARADERRAASMFHREQDIECIQQHSVGDEPRYAAIAVEEWARRTRRGVCSEPRSRSLAPSQTLMNGAHSIKPTLHRT